jgi:hypothetical protein
LRSAGGNRCARDRNDGRIARHVTRQLLNFRHASDSFHASAQWLNRDGIQRFVLLSETSLCKMELKKEYDIFK